MGCWQRWPLMAIALWSAIAHGGDFEQGLATARAEKQGAPGAGVSLAAMSAQMTAAEVLQARRRLQSMRENDGHVMAR